MGEKTIEKQKEQIMLELDSAEREQFRIVTKIFDLESIIKTSKEHLKKMETVEDKGAVISIFKEEFINKNENRLRKLREEHEIIKKKLKENMGKKCQMELESMRSLRARIEKFAERYNLEFSKNKEEIINEIIINSRTCPYKEHPSKWCGAFCPCQDQDVLKELVREGKCKGGLFLLPENVKKELSPVRDLDVDLYDALILAKIVGDKDIEKIPEKGKVTLLIFFADWCEPCNILEKVLERIKDKDVVMKRVDVNRDNGLARRLGISRVPFVAIFDKSGKAFSAISRFLDCSDEEYLNREMEYLKNVISKARKIGQ